MWVSMISLELNAQFAQDSFDAIERDSEITRVTLKNHLENWNKAPLLNSVRKTKVNYTKGQGLSITIDAPNSRVFLENGVKWSFKEDKALLEDLLAAAVNDAVRRVEAQQKEKMSELTGGLQMPPGFKFPFQA